MMSLQFEKLADSQAVWLEAAAPVCYSLGVSIWWAYSNVELQRRAQQLQEGRHSDVHHKLWFVHISVVIVFIFGFKVSSPGSLSDLITM